MPRYRLRTEDEQGNFETFELEAPEMPTEGAFMDAINGGRATKVPEAFGEPPGVSGGPPTLPPSPAEQMQRAEKRGAHWAIPMALPAAGSVVGDVALTPFGLGPVGAAIGGVAGQYANTKLGLEPEMTWEDAALGAALPFSAEMAAKGGIGLLKSSRGGKMALKELLEQRGMETVRRYVATAPEDAIAQTQRLLDKAWDVPIRVQPAAELLQRRGVPMAFLEELGLERYIEPSGASGGLRAFGDMPILHYQEFSGKVGDIFADAAREFERTGAHEARRRAEHAIAVMDGIDASLQDTLKGMATRTGPEVTQMRAVLYNLVGANRRMQVGGEMAALAERYTTRDADGVAHFDVAGFFKELQRKPTDAARQPLYDHLRLSLTTLGEKTPLARSLADVQRKYRKGIQIVPDALEGTAGVAIARGAGQFGLGATIGHLTGLPQAITGAAYVAVHESLASLMMSQKGRWALKQILDKTGGKVTERTLGALASAVRPLALGTNIPGTDEAISTILEPPAETSVRLMPGQLTQPQSRPGSGSAAPTPTPTAAAPAAPPIPPSPLIGLGGALQGQGAIPGVSDLLSQLYNQAFAPLPGTASTGSRGW